MRQAWPEAQLEASNLLSQDPVVYHARVRPERVAVTELPSGRRVTYRELDQRIARCVGALGDLLGPLAGERIAVLARNCLDQVVLYLACQRAGAIFTPLNWRLTGAELGALLEDCAPRLLVLEDEFAEPGRTALARAPDTVSLGLDGADGLGARIERAEPAPARSVDSEAPCVILYTSGTTGRPKGVIITRKGAFFSALNFAMVGDIATDAVLASDAPMFHTVGLFAVTRTALTMGAGLVVTDRFLPARTLSMLSDPAIGVTHYFGVPQIASILRNEPGYPDADLSRLKAMFVGGAPLSSALAQAFLDDGVMLVNGYGMSEVGTAIHMPIDASLGLAKAGAIGHPAPLLEARIVDAEGQAVAQGQLGELWLRGPSVSPGYWRNPQATAETFHGGWLHTGDAVRQDTDGCYWLADRFKDLYISGGENVYPAEVENVLAAHDQVADVAVIGVADPVWGETGVAFLVSRGEARLDEAGILAFCSSRLAKYKRPAQVRFVASIPRTASGKIQKHLLRALYAAEGQGAPEGRAINDFVKGSNT